VAGTARAFHPTSLVAQKGATCNGQLAPARVLKHVEQAQIEIAMIESTKNKRLVFNCWRKQAFNN